MKLSLKEKLDCLLASANQDFQALQKNQYNCNIRQYYMGRLSGLQSAAFYMGSKKTQDLINHLIDAAIQLDR